MDVISTILTISIIRVCLEGIEMEDFGEINIYSKSNIIDNHITF